jgi:hypothetical protein
MNPFSTTDSVGRYAQSLGDLWAKLQSLEMMMRLFLHGLPHSPKLNLPIGIGIFGLKVGEEVEGTHLTQRDFFSTLLRTYNREVVAAGLGSPIDQSLIDLRNALAHGLVAAAEPNGEFHLVHFSKAGKGRLRVSRSDKMTDRWFTDQQTAVVLAFRAVSAAVYRLPPECHKP